MAINFLMTRGQFDPSKEIPDLSGKVIIVTGGNLGLGYETVLELSKHNPAHIWLGARSESKAQDAIRSIKEEVPNSAPITWLPMDLSSFSSVKGAAETFKNASTRLDLLINNAGIMACPPSLTEDGYEAHTKVGVNHMGHALLTKLLLPMLQQTATEPNADVRIVNLSSAGENLAPKGGIVFEELKTDMTRWNGWTKYGQSKLANVLFSRILAEKHPEIISVAIHPGAANTGLQRGPLAVTPWLKWIEPVVAPLVASHPRKIALNQLWASAGDKQKIENGRFYFPIAQIVKGSLNAQDKELAQKLWDWTEKELTNSGFA